MTGLIRLLKWILKAAVFFVLFAFALNNQQDATVHLAFGQQWRAPMTLVVLVALSASFGFALPVATPPNALVFGTGHIRQRDMIRCGLALDAVCIVVITGWALLTL